MARLEEVLRRARFVPPASTWEQVRRGLASEVSAPGRVAGVAGVILLCFLILAAIVYLFNRVLYDLLTGPV